METTLSKDVQEKLDMINWDSLDSIKESIGRYCLDEGIGICDANRTSNVETANKDVANSKDSKLIVLYWTRGDYGRSY